MSPTVTRPPSTDEIATEMYLRDGYPHAVVCKVQLRDGRIGIGIFRPVPGQQGDLGPQAADKAALDDALENVHEVNYEGLQEHVQMMHDRAVARSGAANPECEYCHKRHDSRLACPEYAASRAGADPDHDLQASLGQPAR